jgi:hypothetical protein
MQAGERDVVGLDAFETLSSSILTVIYQHCDFLEYESPKRRVYSRLKGKFYNVLPTVQEIEFYQTSIPELYEHLLHCLFEEMVNPWTRNYEPYSRLAETNAAFGKALGDAMDKFFISRVKTSEAYYQNTTNQYTVWAIKYIEAVVAGTVRPKRPVPKPVNKARQTGSVAPVFSAKTDLTRLPWLMSSCLVRTSRLLQYGRFLSEISSRKRHSSATVAATRAISRAIAMPSCKAPLSQTLFLNWKSLSRFTGLVRRSLATHVEARVI